MGGIREEVSWVLGIQNSGGRGGIIKRVQFKICERYVGVCALVQTNIILGSLNIHKLI